MNGDGVDFTPLDEALADLTGHLDDRDMRAIGKDIGRALRGENAKRIKSNITPGEDPMVPRKPKSNGKLRPGRLRAKGKPAKLREVRSKKMFQRAIRPQYLRFESKTGEVQVGYLGAMARIMRVHHYGERDHVTRDPASPAVTYAERPLLGLTKDDRLLILDKVTAHLVG